MKESKRKWNEDRIDLNKYNEKGIAELGREYDDLPQKEKFYHSIIQLPIVARGITAFLADNSITLFLCASNVIGPNAGKGSRIFFNKYYDDCMKFLRSNERYRTCFEEEWKSEIELANEHLKNENQILSQPQLFYSEFIESERPIIEKIKKAAFKYLEWVKETHIKEIEKEPEIPIPELKDKTELKNKAQDLLVVLSGCWINGTKIMTDVEYKKVIAGVFDLIEDKKVMRIDQKIKTSAPLKFVRRLFREVNTELYGNSIKDCFIEFLHAYFECFSNTESSTTKRHFNEYKDSLFKTDYEKVMKSINK